MPRYISLKPFNIGLEVVNELNEDEVINIINNDLITNKLYPIIYDEDVGVRCIPFYKKVLENVNIYNDLNDHEKSLFKTGIRDLYYAYQNELLTIKEQELLKNIINIIPHDDTDLVMFNGLSCYPYPIGEYKILRYLSIQTILGSEFKEKIDRFLWSYKSAMCFVNIDDLSYHNFENIIPLNDYFNDMNISLKFTNFKEIGNDIFTFDLEGDYNKILKLDEFNLYLNPCNKLDRGGKRLIFDSNYLSKAILKNIKEGPNKLQKNLIMVNHVFRLNHFKPDDKKFLSHYDIPYSDIKNNYYSKYTLILYLTIGENDPILEVNGVKINKFDKPTGVIFHQRYKHEGNPYLNSNKIFLRTELIYKIKVKNFNNEIAKNFNIACYMSKESLFNDEINKYTSELFNNVVERRYSLCRTSVDYKYFIKTINNVSWITNGNDYWFSNNVDIRNAVLLVLIDYFKGYAKKCPYNTKIKTLESHLTFHDTESILNSLSDLNIIDGKRYGMDIQTNSHKLLKNIIKSEVNLNFNFTEDSDRNLKIQQHNADFESIGSVNIFNDQLSISQSDMIIEQNYIKFQNTGLFKNITFAACHCVDRCQCGMGRRCDGDCCDYRENNIDKYSLKIEYFNLPDIPYKSYDNGHHLIIDIFNAGYIFPKTTSFDIFDIDYNKR